jgi:hypothetical protein
MSGSSLGHFEDYLNQDQVFHATYQLLLGQFDTVNSDSENSNIAYIFVISCIIILTISLIVRFYLVCHYFFKDKLLYLK